MSDLATDNKLKWWDALVPAIIFMVAQIVFGLIASAIILTTSALKNNEIEVSATSLAPGLGIATFLSFLFSLGAILLYLKIRKISFKDVGFSKFNYKIFGYIFLFLFVVLITSAIYDTFLQRFGFDTDAQVKNIVAIFGKKPISIVFMYLTIGILAPIVEELVFRGFLFRYLESVMDFRYAASISALIFSFFHFYPLLIPVLFLLGFLLAYLVHKTDSIWPSISFHFIYNSLVFVIMIKYFI